MRQLLKVLRETGFSDETHEGVQPDMQLRPAASLDSQMQHAGTFPPVRALPNKNSGNNQGVHGAVLQ